MMNKKTRKFLYFGLLILLIVTPLCVFAGEATEADDKYASSVADNGGSDIIDDCSGTLGSGVTKFLTYLYKGMYFAVPALTVVLIVKDMVVAVGSGKEEDMKKATSTAVKRLVIGLVIFFIPLIINLILKYSGLSGC